MQISVVLFVHKHLNTKAYIQLHVACRYRMLLYIVRKKIRRRRLFKKVQAFCEEKVLRYLLGIFWYAESKHQCWQAEK